MSLNHPWLPEVSATSVTSRARHALMSQLDRLSPYRAHRWTEGQLCEDFDLGRAAIRSALVDLRTWNLVRAIPRRGYTIEPLTSREWTDLSTLWRTCLARCTSVAPMTDDVDGDINRLVSAYMRTLDSSPHPTCDLGRSCLPLLRRYLLILPGESVEQLSDGWHTLSALPTVQFDAVRAHCDAVVSAVRKTLSEQESAW